MRFELDFTKYEELAREVVSEGVVLLKNDDNTLPLTEGTRVALFGRMQNHYYRSGSGSGGMVNAPTNVSLAQAFDADERVVLDADLKQVYADWEMENPYQRNKGYGLELWSQEEMPVSGELAERFAAKNDVAVVIIARTAGEDRDNSGDAGSYELQTAEEQLLENVCTAFKRVIVVLNIGNVIDMRFVKKYNPQAVLIGWQGGMMGAYGTVDVITGRQTPSGHLTDSIAEKISDYPAYSCFGDKKRNFYKEDIYVGYRYFETFAKDKVLYPFGFGLSYTSFTRELKSFEFDGESINIELAVTNAGEVKGKDVVMIFVEAPQGKLGKPSRALAGFRKTKSLQPGETEVVSLSISRNRFASYDDAGAIAGGFVLEAGKYTVYAGCDVRSAEAVADFSIAADEVVEELKSAMKPALDYQRIKPVSAGDTYEISYESVPLRKAETILSTAPVKEYSAEKEITFTNVALGKASLDEFIEGLTDDDLCCIVRGEGMRSRKVTPGTASAFGGVNEHLKSLDIPCGCCDDGPSGMRLDSGMKAFSLPNGTMMASTFNTEIINELYKMTGVEMRLNRVDVLLGPGMNIHRHAYNGRNFEYFSEDPLLSGLMAAAQISALQSVGVDGVIKHFCGNNQETERYKSDSVISERALREIYLKGFEIAVREANAHFVMTTYGRVNGMWTSNDPELTQVILRDQWGFDGMVMTDWWAAINENGRMEEAGSEGSHTNFISMVKARNDIYMCCPDSATNGHGDNLAEGLENGTLTRADLCICAKNILSTILRLPAMERVLGEECEVEILNQPGYWIDSLDNVQASYVIDKDEVVINLEALESARSYSYAFAIEFAKTGKYTFELEVEASSKIHVPIPVSLLINGQPSQILTFYGLDGDIMARETVIDVNEKTAIWKLFFSHDGLQTRKMRIKYGAR